MKKRDKEFNKQLEKVAELLQKNSKQRNISFTVYDNVYGTRVNTINYDGNCFYATYEESLDTKLLGQEQYHLEFYGRTVDELQKNYKKAVKRMHKYMKARKLKNHKHLCCD